MVPGMKNRLEERLEKFNQLEAEPLVKFHRKEKELHYEVRDKKVHFKESVRRRHVPLAKKPGRYWRESGLSSWLTTPVILSCIIPISIADLWASGYQPVCFPSYGIPKVRRADRAALVSHPTRAAPQDASQPPRALFGLWRRGTVSDPHRKGPPRFCGLGNQAGQPGATGP